MKEQQTFEHLVADSVGGIGPLAPSAGAIDRTISRVRGRRQRPHWLAVVKEPPMRRGSRLAVGSPTARVASIMVATMLVALALAAAAVAGSRLLADDGKATVRNGPIIVNGVSYDPYTGETGPDPCDGCTTDASWSVDGQRVAFRRSSQIWVADLAEARKWHLADCTDCEDDHISMAADGRSVAFTDEGDVWLVDVDTGVRTPVTNLGEGRHARSPSIAPGGERVAFAIDGEPGIWVTAIAGGEPWQLTSEAGDGAPFEPAWSPDGRTIAYLTDPPAAGLFSLQLWLVDVASGEPRRIWDSPVCCTSTWSGPTWSPDGQELAVVAADTSQDDTFPIRSWALWVVAADGSTARKLGNADAVRPAWQPEPLAEAATPPVEDVEDSPMPT